ncbi:hypothetical protein [Kocuria sp. WN036]|uniref:hypothetical protein n=1 Tax=Kocuria sp. WN036 TaxID=2032628 RepID=UPI001140C3E4|nr:hypothetical protein [Kocuria sp. WN036]
MNSTPTPAQRLAAAYGRTETPQDERRRADAAANYRPGQAEELTAAADRFPGRGTLRLQAAYAQAAKAAHDELGKQ